MEEEVVVMAVLLVVEEGKEATGSRPSSNVWAAPSNSSSL